MIWEVINFVKKLRPLQRGSDKKSGPSAQPPTPGVSTSPRAWALGPWGNGAGADAV